MEVLSKWQKIEFVWISEDLTKSWLSKAIVQAVLSAGGKVSGPIPLPTHIKKYTVLRSPHVNKKSREQFEMRTHKRLIDIYAPSIAVKEVFSKIELPDGVEVEMKD